MSCPVIPRAYAAGSFLTTPRVNADMMTDMQIFTMAQEAAKDILAKDPELKQRENLGLGSEVSRLFDSERAMN